MWRMQARLWVLFAAVLLVLLGLAATQADFVGLQHTDEHGMTPLMRAAQRGDRVEVARRLHGFLPRVNAQVSSNDLQEFIAFLSWMQSVPKRDVGYTALMYAVQSRHREIVEDLLRAGANVNLASRDGFTALTLTVFNQDLDLARLLISHGARVDQSHSMAMAAASESSEMLRLLLDSGGSPNPPSPTRPGLPVTPLQAAVRAHRTENVRLLLAAGASVNVREAQNGWTLLRRAKNDGAADIAELLRTAGASDDGEADDALLAALRNRDSQAAQQALSAGANPNTRDQFGQYPLQEAVQRGDLDRVRVLLAAHADPNLGSVQKPLFIAAQRGYAEIVQALLDAGARDKNESLVVAVGDGHREIVAMLLQAGADVHFGADTALRKAAHNADLELVNELLAAGADPGARAEDGETALHAAAYKGSRELIQLFLSKGLDPNATMINGYTPLLSAVVGGNLEGAQTLLAAGANPNARDSDGHPILYWVKTGPKATRADMEALLRAAGAQE
jgi:cytohesin